VLDQDEAAVQEEWDAIPLESSARPSVAAVAAASADAAPVDASPFATISYDDALAALAAVDMSSAAARVVLYEVPASCFGRLLHCLSRPSLHIQNAEEELRLPFLLALTPFDRCFTPTFTSMFLCIERDALCCSTNATHMAMIATFYSKITATTRAVERIGRCSPVLHRFVSLSPRT
jgi:hypothetical protein